MFVVAFCACMVHAQVLHRYVVEVETVPDKREYKAEKLVNGNVRLEPQGPKKTVRYYEILSRTPLTAKQCQDSIRLGKARQVSKPVRKYRHRKNVTLGKVGTVSIRRMWNLQSMTSITKTPTCMIL